VRHPAYIAWERFQERKGEDWGADSVGGEQGKEIGRRRGEEQGVPDTWARDVSDGRERKARARASWVSGGSLGSAQAEMRGKESGPRVRGRPKRWAAGCGLS
jgi:hypothetical protein